MNSSDQKLQERKDILIIDTNAFIKCLNIIELAQKYDLYTSYDVIREIKDQKTQNYLTTLPFQLQTHDPSDQALRFIDNFAKKTGDFSSLSITDKELMAIAYTFIQEKNLQHLLRKEPPEITEATIQDYNKFRTLPQESADIQQDSQQNQDEQQKTNQLIIDNKSNQVTNEDTKKNEHNNKDQQDQDEGWITIPKKNKKQVPKQFEQQQQQMTQTLTDQKQNEKDLYMENDQEEQEEDDQEGWINAQNIDQFLCKSKQAIEEQKQFGVQVMTSDYAMQNVLLQMGIPILAPDGMIISKAKRFILECYSCYFLCKDTSKQFCPECGNHSLLKVSCSINADGTLKLYRKKNFQVQTRGFIYPIPKPKTGKHANNLILREDEFLQGGRNFILRKQQKEKEKQFDKNMIEFDNGFSFDNIKVKEKPTQKIQYGYGRMNPNDNFANKGRNKKYK